MTILDPLKAQTRKIKPLVALIRAIRIAVDPVGRTAWMIGRRSPDWLMQPAATTCFDRHPFLFEFVKAALASTEGPRILSYGCSSGEEPISLARAMPEAFVRGVDINPVSIRMAEKLRRRLGIDNVAFAVAQSPSDELPATYDAVFCLSVLRHGVLEGGWPEKCAAIMPFSKFQTMVAALDRCVKPGGYLVLWGCNFRFADTTTRSQYDLALDVPRRESQKRRPLYGRDDRLLAQDFYGEYVFRKRGADKAEPNTTS